MWLIYVPCLSLSCWLFLPATGSYNLDGTIGSAEDTVQYISSVNFPSLYARYVVEYDPQISIYSLVFKLELTRFVWNAIKYNIINKTLSELKFMNFYYFWRYFCHPQTFETSEICHRVKYQMLLIMFNGVSFMTMALFCWSYMLSDYGLTKRSKREQYKKITIY